MHIPFPPLIPCPPPIVHAVRHVVQHAVKTKHAVVHGWRHVTHPVHHYVHTAVTHVHPIAGTACQYAPHFLAATLLALAPASQATQVREPASVPLPDIRTTDISSAPGDIGVWPSIPRDPIIPILGTGPGSIIVTVNTDPEGQTTISADRGDRKSVV